MAAIAARGTLLYLGVVNAGAAVLFGYDKFQAQNGGWRISEKQLCTSALLGGWIGGYMAMQAFHHKTRKQSFQDKYIRAVTANAAGGGVALSLATRNPAFRVALRQTASNWVSQFARGTNSQNRGGRGGRGGFGRRRR